MNWDDCTYCSSGKMIPAGQSRVASYDPEITEIAHECDSCQNHNDTYLWVPDDEATPTRRNAIYGYVSELETDPHVAIYGDANEIPRLQEKRSNMTMPAIVFVLFVLVAIVGWAVI